MTKDAIEASLATSLANQAKNYASLYCMACDKEAATTALIFAALQEVATKEVIKRLAADL